MAGKNVNWRLIASLAFLAIAVVIIITCTSGHLAAGKGESPPETRDKADQADLTARVCAPFFLKDEAGNIINPVTGENADKPYSPRRLNQESKR